MQEIRIHGRGGQGVVTASELVAISAFKNNHFAQAFPYFGVERTGAPIEAYSRIDDKFIRTREQVYNPEILIILDASLLNTTNLVSGCNHDTIIIINTTLSVEKIKEILQEKWSFKTKEKNIHTLDATAIALKILGKNLANTVILGLLAKNSKLISLESTKEAIKEKFQEKGKDIIQKNIKAISKAYEK
jgi:pyruvate ferredoxin oxidoreductase gamma subunit/2-oxoisovalerate ferredoxin oxidoreductase gamma subunit